MLIKENCDCWCCKKTLALALRDNACVYCGVPCDVYFVDDEGRPWCESCGKMFHAECSYAIRHARHDFNECTTCPDAALLDRDGDVWFPIPTLDDSYSMKSLHERWEQGTWRDDERTRRSISMVYGPVRLKRFVVHEEEELSLAWP